MFQAISILDNMIHQVKGSGVSSVWKEEEEWILFYIRNICLIRRLACREAALYP